ncbi:hypothetical protein CEXT_471731 [Caerostris extrusa]|uniref:Uncharacterized protein n=1 Tax=Caerostris extrusa TaxID=172846 RepID=A0AAV4RPF8_CAEEX|nr:hypothetical protein CEXT_471731 [Caerostris extrusa]
MNHAIRLYMERIHITISFYRDVNVARKEDSFFGLILVPTSHIRMKRGIIGVRRCEENVMEMDRSMPR